MFLVSSSSIWHYIYLWPPCFIFTFIYIVVQRFFSFYSLRSLLKKTITQQSVWAFLQASVLKVYASDCWQWRTVHSSPQSHCVCNISFSEPEHSAVEQWRSRSVWTCVSAWTFHTDSMFPPSLWLRGVVAAKGDNPIKPHAVKGFLRVAVNNKLFLDNVSHICRMWYVSIMSIWLATWACLGL